MQPLTENPNIRLIDVRHEPSENEICVRLAHHDSFALIKSDSILADFTKDDITRATVITIDYPNKENYVTKVNVWDNRDEIMKDIQRSSLLRMCKNGENNGW